MILRFIKRILDALFVVFFGVLCFFMVFRVPTAIFAAYIALSLVLVYRIRSKGFVFFLALGSFLIRFAYISIVKTPLESDFKLLYEAAVLFSQGDYSFSELVYFRDWAYQTGFVIYQGLVVKLFGPDGSIWALKILNCLWNTGITLLIYLIAGNFFKERSSRLASVLYMGFVFPITFVSVLSNQHISTFFILLGLYFLMDQKLIRMKPLPRGLLAGLFIALGNIMRPDALLVMVSLAGYFLILLLRPGNGKQRLERLMQCLAVFLVYLAVNSLASQAIIRSGVNTEGLRNNNFYWKFVVGLNYEHRGGYNEDDYLLIYGSGLTEEKREELEKQVILERLGMGPKKFASLFMQKIQFFWCDSALDWSYGHILRANKVFYLLSNPVKFSDVDAVLKDLNELFIYTAMLLSLLGVFARRKEEKDDRLAIPAALLLISFVVYLLIEVQPRYAYLQQPFLFILSGMGLDFLSDRLDVSTLRMIWEKLKGKAGQESIDYKGRKNDTITRHKSMDN
ncbi:ArnT family glycosyltransferase [Thermoclostridium caenicola]|uniref:Dolichyl-phosphate-mannose-protein mannosyltransferase n=1 Tax=Thermoclostridium caenicola TaxID=659425 RepID=A0A1M6HC92_9FIRM|nr:glycosyltransferase family 39 protein [Thermoclostridium caenicola]SHJ19817.1 Dolichyl-phosphate-mannose-protein mannosyltransferase [Thermoclostridium caenicola]